MAYQLNSLTMAASNPKASFKTTLLQTGKNTTGIVIPPDIIDKLGAGKKPPVKVTVNGFTYRSTVAVMGGKFMVGVNADNRAAAQVKGGDAIDVSLELDTEPRVLELPDEFKEALAKHPAAKEAFERLSYSKQQLHVIPIAKAKTKETRDRNILKALNALNPAG